MGASPSSDQLQQQLSQNTRGHCRPSTREGGKEGAHRARALSAAARGPHLSTRNPRPKESARPGGASKRKYAGGSSRGSGSLAVGVIRKSESKAHLEPETLLHSPKSQPEHQCTAKIRIWKQCTACTVDDVTGCRYVDLASQVDFTGKQKGLLWCQPSAIPWHPLHSEACKARCSLGSPHTQTSLEDHVFELFCDAMDDSTCVKPTKVLMSPVVTIFFFG